MRLKPSDIGACWDLPLSRMRSLRALGFMPRRILDIGAYRGAWSEVMWHVWPEAQYHLIEANEECEPYLKQTGFPYTVALLGERSQPTTYYKCQTGSGEGNGMFKENSIYPFLPTSAQVRALDYLFVPYPSDFDLIKIDAQGAELRILEGGKDTISRATIVQLECQIQRYNEGAPLAPEVIAYMDSIGFRWYDIAEYHINSRGMLIQADLVFAKKDSPLFGLKVLS